MCPFETQNSFEHIDRLSYEIGPRLAGSERGALAANYVKDELDNCDLETKIQNFDFLNRIFKMKAVSLVLATIFLVAPFLYQFNPPFLLVAVVGGYLICYRISIFLPKENGRNVIGSLKSEGEIYDKIVLGAHYDTSTCFKSRKLDLVYRIFFPIILFIFLIISIFGIFTGHIYFLGAWLVILIPFLFLSSIPFWAYESLVSAGANDNASGVSVMLEIANVLSGNPPEGKEIIFVAFDAEEQDLSGSETFVDTVDHIDLFLNLDSVGSGDFLALIEGNGILRKVNTSKELNERIGKKFDMTRIWTPFSGYDHIPFLRRGIRSTTLSSFESLDKNELDGFLESFLDSSEVRTVRDSNMHSLEDTPEKIKLNNIEKSGQMILDMIRNCEN